MTILICMCEKAITNIKLKYALFLLGVNNHSHDTKRQFWKIEKTGQFRLSATLQEAFCSTSSCCQKLPSMVDYPAIFMSISQVVREKSYVHHKVCLEWPISGVPRVNCCSILCLFWTNVKHVSTIFLEFVTKYRHNETAPNRLMVPEAIWCCAHGERESDEIFLVIPRKYRYSSLKNDS